MYRIGWIDSAHMPSRIHATVDGKETLCGGHGMYIKGRQLAIVPRKLSGYSQYCRICFAKGGKSAPWDPRCKEVEWLGPAPSKFTNVGRSM